MHHARAAVRVAMMSAAIGGWAASVLHAGQGAAQVPPTSATESEFPEGKGQDVFVSACGECHEPGLATATRQAREDWKGIVAEMKDRGAMLSDGDVTIVVDYLTEVLRAGAEHQQREGEGDRAFSRALARRGRCHRASPQRNRAVQELGRPRAGAGARPQEDRVEEEVRSRSSGRRRSRPRTGTDDPPWLSRSRQGRVSMHGRRPCHAESTA